MDHWLSTKGSMSYGWNGLYNFKTNSFTSNNYFICLFLFFFYVSWFIGGPRPQSPWSPPSTCPLTTTATSVALLVLRPFDLFSQLNNLPTWTCSETWSSTPRSFTGSSLITSSQWHVEHHLALKQLSKSQHKVIKILLLFKSTLYTRSTIILRE